MNEPVYVSTPLSQQIAHCAAAVQQVLAGHSLTPVLAAVPAQARPAVQSLSFHVMRWLGTAQALREMLAPRRPEPALEALLLSALALLWPPASPPYAQHTLVDEAVKAVRRHHQRQAGFVNAVLRRMLREQAVLEMALAPDLRAAFNHPAWWVERLRKDWGHQADAVLRQAQVHPPMTLRVNRRRLSRDDYCRELTRGGMAHRISTDPQLAQLVELVQAVPVTRLPGFAEGWVSVQDASAQRAAPFLLGDSLPEGSRVLDACAAPGGKTAHLLESAGLDLLALDHDETRLPRVASNLQRLGLHAEMKAADAGQPQTWWDGRAFDAILLDAPCSASGIVRRHPDIRWLRRPTDIDTLATTQLQLLHALWPLLKPGGRLVFATCSVFKAEGEQVLDAFLQRLGDQARIVPANGSGHLLPLPQNEVPPVDATCTSPGDGFFYALLLKHL